MKRYFVKQKLLGVLLLVVTALAMFVAKDATIAFITIPLGLMLIFSKEMLMTDKYYFEVNQTESEEL